MNGYQFNNIFTWLMLVLGCMFGLVLGSLSSWVQYNLVPIIIIGVSFTVLILLKFWTKIKPFEDKLKEFEV